MAQTKKKRKKKQRGTQAGSLDARKKSRPRNRAEARSQAKSGGGTRTRAQKGDAPPTWKSATVRGAIAAAVFMALLMVVFGRSFTEAIPIGAFMLVFYIPAGYYMDQMMWRRRERAKIRAGAKK